MTSEVHGPTPALVSAPTPTSPPTPTPSLIPTPSMRRFEAVPVSTAGTTEKDWAPWLSAHLTPPLDLGSIQQLIVVGAHPDDEVLGAGGIMSAAAFSGIEVRIVCMSDGASSHPGSPTLTADQLTARRHLELDTAAHLLGVGRPQWHGLPDGELAAHRSTLVEILDRQIEAAGDRTVGLLSVWSADGHPDHEALGSAAAEVAAHHEIPIWMYPIWMWHWARPGDQDVPWQHMRAHRLEPAALAVKRAAVHAFGSQVLPLSSAADDQPVLPPHVLAHLTRATEYVFS